MNPINDLIAKKLVNVLIPDAEAESFIQVLPQTQSVLGEYKAFHKGLWVGGTLLLTTSSLEFRPNGLNRLMHRGDASRGILLKDVVDVKDRFGIATRIVDVLCHKGPPLTFRCYGAKRFVEQIRAQLAPR
jgi:hypothetical protein